LKALLKDYVQDIFLTSSLLQQTRTAIRKQVFGDADTNVMYVPALERLLHDSGHHFEFYVREKDYVLRKCEEIALSQHIALKKVEGTKLMCTEKIEYIKQWKHDNKVMLEESGISPNASDTPTLEPVPAVSQRLMAFHACTWWLYARATGLKDSMRIISCLFGTTPVTGASSTPRAQVWILATSLCCN